MYIGKVYLELYLRSPTFIVSSKSRTFHKWTMLSLQCAIMDNRVIQFFSVIALVVFILPHRTGFSQQYLSHSVYSV